MILRLLDTMVLIDCCLVSVQGNDDRERFHAPRFYQTTMDPQVDRGTGTYRPNIRYTPDFRVPENMLESWSTDYYESHRPYRISPHRMQAEQFPEFFFASYYGCYCTTVYRRLRLLAGCAVITYKHILTSAAATELVLRKHRRAPDLENILGLWYDNNFWLYNSSMYAFPVRIHYHPLFTLPHRVNRTHPFPVMWDMSVWAMPHTLNWQAMTCNRAAPYQTDLNPAVIDWGAHYNVIGYQFVRAYNRIPRPFYKYTVRLEAENDAIRPCPKVEWGWLRCLKSGSWAPLGVELGAPLHRTTRGSRSRYSGLIGLNTLNLKLRSVQTVSYFNDYNVHRALDFIYDAYNARVEYVYLDHRYEDTNENSPKLKPGFKAPHNYFRDYGVEAYKSPHCCLPESKRLEHRIYGE